ncbi:SUZ domain-containing protein 1-like isoform X1 [Ornithodoros turicata]
MADDISEDICDDWEDIVENGVLEKELERLKVKTCSKNSEHPTFHAGDMAVPRVLLEDPLRTQYTPTVKILKRPPDATKSGVTANGTGSEKSPNRQPVKTLQQREAEYAEARLRILGSARSEDDSQKESPTVTTYCANPSESWHAGGEQVIRQPRGPDCNSNGFQQPRR